MSARGQAIFALVRGWAEWPDNQSEKGMPSNLGPSNGRVLEGASRFNRREFFAAHELWEEVWRESPSSGKRVLQGLIQVAVAFHHHQAGNIEGSLSLLRRGLQNLQSDPALLGALNGKKLLDDVEDVIRRLDSNLPVTYFTIEFS